MWRPTTIANPSPPRIDTERLSFLLAQGHQVHAPTEQEERDETEKDSRKNGSEISRGDRRETTQQPKGNGRKLVVWIGEILDKTDRGTEQGTDHNASEDQYENGIVMSERGADGIDGCNCAQTYREGERLYSNDAEREVDTEHSSKSCARGNAKNIRRHQRIAKQSLIGGTR